MNIIIDLSKLVLNRNYMTKNLYFDFKKGVGKQVRFINLSSLNIFEPQIVRSKVRSLSNHFLGYTFYGLKYELNAKQWVTKIAFKIGKKKF